MKNLKNKKGFTLVELIVVIAILGILALFLVPSFKGYSEDAKKQVAQGNARTVWEAAKIAETKAEYDKTITSQKELVAEMQKKLGETSFKIEMANVSFKGETLEVTGVNYTTNGVACNYGIVEGELKFTGKCAE